MLASVGILGKEPVALSIVEALRRLEYRGYDSRRCCHAGKGRHRTPPCPGKLKNLEERLRAEPMLGVSGIATPAGHPRPPPKPMPIPHGR